MRNYFTIFAFIFLLNCTFNGSKQGVTNIDVIQNEINDSEEYTFEEYVNLLININKSKEYPDINIVPD